MTYLYVCVIGENCFCLWSVRSLCLAFAMTPVTSAAKMVSQLRRWLTGDDVTADSHHSVEGVSRHCSGSCTCNCATDKLQYRGRSYSDCCAASCRGDCQDVAVRERSYSVNSRHMTLQGSKRLSSRAYQTSSGSTWSPVRQRDVREVLDEDRELCRCWSGSVEPVCCCERCFVYIDERPPLPPPPYSELMLLERCADLAKRLNNAEPSITVNTADVSDQEMIAAEAAVSRTPSLAESCQLAGEQSAVTVSSCLFSALLLCTL